MEQRTFGSLGYDVSALSLGGGGIGQVWGPTTREESVATTREAIELGINLLDLAPSYGDGEAERVVGEAFDGRLPDGVLVSTKCRVNAPPPGEVAELLEPHGEPRTAAPERVDVFIIHNMLVTDADADRYAGTPLTLFEESVRRGAGRRGTGGRVGHHGHRRAGCGDHGAAVGDAARRGAVHREPARLGRRDPALRRRPAPARGDRDSRQALASA